MESCYVAEGWRNKWYKDTIKTNLCWCKVRPKELEACYQSIASVCHVPLSICKLQSNPASEIHYSKWTVPPHNFDIDHNHWFQLKCLQCSKLCMSRHGLQSQLWIHWVFFFRPKGQPWLKVTLRKADIANENLDTPVSI